MKKKISFIVCIMVVIQLACIAVYADSGDLQNMRAGWYAADGTEITEDESGASYFTRMDPANKTEGEEDILVLKSASSNVTGADRGQQLYKLFNTPIYGKLRVTFDLYCENIGGFGFSVLTEEGQVTTTDWILSIDTGAGSFGYNSTSMLGNNSIQQAYTPARKPAAATWEPVVVDIDTESGMITGSINGLVFSCTEPLAVISDQAIYGITLLNMRGASPWLKYVRNMKFYSVGELTDSVVAASDKISVTFHDTVTADVLSNIKIFDTEENEVLIKEISVAEDERSAVITTETAMEIDKTYILTINGGYLLENGLYAPDTEMEFVCSRSGCLVDSFTVDEVDGEYRTEVRIEQLVEDTDDKLILAYVAEKDGIVCGFEASVENISQLGSISITKTFTPIEDSDKAYFYIWNESSRAPLNDFIVIDRELGNV